MSSASPKARPLVFDLDGTLIDSRKDIAAACNFALEQVGQLPLPEELISSHVGAGARALLVGVLGEAAAQVDFDQLLRHFQAFYSEHPTDQNCLMPGAEIALSLRSKDRPIALCTNKPKHLTEAVLESLGWRDRFDAIAAPQPGDPVKPHPALLQSVSQQLKVAPESLIMIGDSPQDVGAGKAVGAHTIGIKGGFLPLERLVQSGPDALLATLSDLPAYLEQFEVR